MKKILLLVNPHSRSGEKSLEETVSQLEKSHHDIIELTPEERDFDPNDLIEKYKSDIECVMVGGGDGSVNRALPALVKTQIPLLVFPLGTANNLARTYSLPNTVPEALSLIDHGKVISVDLGVVNGIYFVNVAGLGLSTRINHQVPDWFKKYFGVFAFIFTAFQLARKARPFHATITADDKKVQSRSWQISVCNGKFYGSGLRIKDSASLVDEKLHCLSTEVEKWWHALSLIPSFFRGKYTKKDAVTLVSGKSILIETRTPLKIDVDGDIKTSTPAKFTVEPKILRLMVPAQSL
jgi:YegS/Rv2252/BmrU family lipid kinase